jgi:TRAP-type mannitol/chloroaromatic compound transport system permease small subunit
MVQRQAARFIGTWEETVFLNIFFWSDLYVSLRMMESRSSRWFNDVGWYLYRYFFMDGLV